MTRAWGTRRASSHRSRRSRRGAIFEIAQFYEKGKKWDGALVYYNEVLIKDAGSPLANQARERIDLLKRRAATK